jgi:hypothetical protein
MLSFTVMNLYNFTSRLCVVGNVESKHGVVERHSCYNKTFIMRKMYVLRLFDRCTRNNTGTVTFPVRS